MPESPRCEAGVVDAWQHVVIVTTAISENKETTCMSNLCPLASCRLIIGVGDVVPHLVACPNELAIEQCSFKLYIVQ